MNCHSHSQATLTGMRVLVFRWSLMEGWEDDSDLDLASETLYQQTNETMWQQLQQQHAELRLRRNETISTSGLQRSSKTHRALNTHTTNDEKLRRRKISPRQPRYYAHTNTGFSHRHGDDSSFLSDVDCQAPKNYSLCTTFNRSTIPVDYIKLNRHQLKGHNNRKFTYPQKTYTEMFSKKRHSSVGYTNSSHKNGKCLLLVSCFNCDRP